MAQCQVGHPPSWTCAVCPEKSSSPPEPPQLYFNEQGELIPYVVVPRIAAAALVKIPRPSPRIEMNDDDDLDLELQYPDDEATAPPPASCSTPTMAALEHSQSPHVLRMRSPSLVPLRTDLSTTIPDSVQGAARDRKVLNPLPYPSSTRSTLALLCPTDGCNGITPTAGRRCLSCIHSSWSRLRGSRFEGQSTEVVPLPRANRQTRNGLVKEVIEEVIDLTAAAEEKKEKKKKVKKNVRLLVRVPGTSDTEIVVLERPVVDPVDADPTAVESWNGTGWDSDLTDLTSDDDETEVQPVVEPPRTPFKIRIPPRSLTKPLPRARENPSSEPLDTSSSNIPSAPLTTNPTSYSPSPSTAPHDPGNQPAAVPARRLCTIARCRAPIPPITEYRWKCCTSCRTHYRQYQRDRLKGLRNAAAANTPGNSPTPPQLAQESSAPHTPVREQSAVVFPGVTPVPIAPKSRQRKEWEREEMRRALEASIMPHEQSDTVPPDMSAQAQLTRFPEGYVSGARVCMGHTCEQILPGEAEYPSEFCMVCGRRERLGLVYPITLERRPGRCKYADCGTLIVDRGIEECQQCVKRMRKSPAQALVRKKKLKAPGTPTPPPRPDVVNHEQSSKSSRKRKRVSPYPVYQSRDAVIRDFGTRFIGFIQAQSYYAMMRGGTLAGPTMFDFCGEYSIVALDLDVVGRRPMVEAHARNVKSDIERVCGIEFSPTSWVSILGSPRGIINRFACTHVVDMQRVPPPPGCPPFLDPPLKTMQGELEVAVLADDSHRCLAGEKTIVRFRLVG
ncbi:hypothetical protein C8F01DRAFT_1125380 [Mycena amicta]|nr:hypothetical protein C8F01DRAFT_1125380 [Mycena amicta]